MNIGSGEISQNSSYASAQCRHAFYPLVIYLFVALPILGWDIHLRQAARTFVRVAAQLEGGPLEAPLQVEIDGKPASLDASVPIGHRTIRLGSRDTETWSTNRFVWYGDNPLGTVQLRRSRGDLTVAVKPVPLQVTLSGRLTNATSGVSNPSFKGLPVGEYQVELQFQHFTEKLRVRVERNGTHVLNRAFPVAHLKAESMPAGSSFEVLAPVGERWFFRGETPGVVNDLPPGRYRVTFARGDYRKQETVFLTAGTTNGARAVFDYGNLNVTTEPTNAVVALDGQEAGTTPMVLTNLIPGRHSVTVRRQGFQAGRWDVDVKGEQTITLTTNLLSNRFVEAMRSAKAHLNGFTKNYPAALAKLSEALDEKPGDAEAEGLKVEARFALHLQEARSARFDGQLTNALKAVEAALALQPGRGEAATLKNSIESDLHNAVQARQMAARRQAEEEQRRLALEKEAAERQSQIMAARKAAELALAQKQIAQETKDRFDKAMAGIPKGQRPVWVTSAGFDKAVEALLRTLPLCAEKWKITKETKEADWIQLSVTGVGILSSNQRALLQCSKSGEATEVRVAFWFDDTKGLLASGTIETDPGYIAEAFRKKLEGQLGRPLK